MYFLASLITSILLLLGFGASLQFKPAFALYVAAAALAVLTFGWPLVFRRTGGVFARILILASGAASLVLFWVLPATISGQYLLLVLPTCLVLAFVYFLLVPIARTDMTTQLAAVMTAVMAATATSGWLAMSLDSNRGVVGVVAALSATVAAVLVAFPGPRWLWGVLGTVLGSAMGFAACFYVLPLSWTVGTPIAVICSAVAASTLLLFRATAPVKTIGGAAATGAFAVALVGITAHVVSLMIVV